MKPITVIWSDGVSEAEANESIGAMREFLRYLQGVAQDQDIGLTPIVLRPFGNWILKGAAGMQAYHSFRWYWESSLDQHTGRVSAATFIEIVRYEPWQHAEPHLDLALLHTELCNDTQKTDGDFPSVFACTEPDLVTVISIRHLSHIADRELRLKCLRSLVLHNFGHLVGLPYGLQSTKRQPPESTAVPRDSSRTCAMPCIMYEAQSVDELMAVATGEKEDLVLCRPCLEVLRSLVFSLHFSAN